MYETVLINARIHCTIYSIEICTKKIPLKLTGGKLIIKTAWLSNNYFGILYYKKLCCPTNFRFLVQLADLMIIKCTKIKMIWFLDISFRLRLSGWCTVWIGEGGGCKKEKRIGLCFALNLWSGWWHHVLFLSGWIDFHTDISTLSACAVFYGVYTLALSSVWTDD